MAVSILDDRTRVAIEEGRDARRASVDRLVPFVRQVLPLSLLFLGVLHVIFGAALTRMLPVWPDSPPGRPYWTAAMGVALAAAAGIVLARARSRGAALWLAALLLLPVLALHLPRALPSGDFGNAWLGVFKWLAMAAAPVVLAADRPAARVEWRDRAVAMGAAMAPWLLGAFMITSAILHVRFAEFVSQLMQPWMPWRLFWTYFAAVALAAGGIGLVIPRTFRLAALLTSLMIFLWFLLVHIPRMLIDPAGPVGWSEMAESLAFSAMAFLLATRR